VLHGVVAGRLRQRSANVAPVQPPPRLQSLDALNCSLRAPLPESR